MKFAQQKRASTENDEKYFFRIEKSWKINSYPLKKYNQKDFSSPKRSKKECRIGYHTTYCPFPVNKINQVKMRPLNGNSRNFDDSFLTLFQCVQMPFFQTDRKNFSSGSYRKVHPMDIHFKSDDDADVNRIFGPKMDVHRTSCAIWDFVNLITGSLLNYFVVELWRHDKVHYDQYKGPIWMMCFFAASRYVSLERVTEL